MKISKKLFGLFLAFILMVALSGCEQSTTGDTASTSSTSSSTTSGTTTSGTTSTTDQQTTNTGGAVTDLDGEEVAVTNSASANDSSTSSTAGTSSTAQKVAQIAATFPSRYSSRQSFPYASGTESGNLGCANVVSAVLKEAGVSAWSLGCYDLRTKLQGQGWTRVSPPPKAGDVIIWSPLRAGGHPHIGVAIQSGNSIMAMNNSSGQRRPILSGWNYRGVETILRKA